jgi:tetratricopeptide (TPR) repeat protein
MRLHLSGLSAFALLALSSAAFGAEEAHPYPECTHEASDADLTAAKAAFQAGNVSFNEADYPRAILYWEDAFRRDCSAHPLLMNLARAYELNGQKQQAVVALETFLEREPNSTERAPIQRRIEVLKKQLESEQAAATAAAAPPPGPAPAAAPAPQPQPPNLAEHPHSQQVLPLVVAGVGAAVFVLGGLVYLDAAKQVKKFETDCGKTHDKCPENYDTGPANAAAKRETAGGAVAIIGLPILAGGLVWYFVANSSPKTAALTSSKTAVVTPALAPGFYGVALNSRF